MLAKHGKVEKVSLSLDYYVSKILMKKDQKYLKDMEYVFYL